jgi:hypothetical protein
MRRRPVGSELPQAGADRHGNVLVVTWLDARHRGSTLEMLYSFERWSAARCFYLNAAVRRLPRWMGHVDFDLIVFDPLFLLSRWFPELFSRLCRRIAPLRQWPAARVALPQDEHLATPALNWFIGEFGIDHVFSCAGESEWPRIYAEVDFARVGFTRVLPGYLEDATVARIDRLAAQESGRPVDIGYRARPGYAWTGRHGQLKSAIATAVKRAAAGTGLNLDISIDEADTLYGDAWLEFLLRCKYTIGVEGGSSILNASRQTVSDIMNYTRAHPESPPEVIEARFLRGMEGTVALRAISPRHLEACATRTCQVLVEGDYSGVLRAGEHYIPVRPDFSNLEEVIATIVRDDHRDRLTTVAYRDVVASGAFSYQAFVRDVERAALGAPLPSVGASALTLALYAWSRAAHRVSNGVVRVRVAALPTIHRFRVRAALGQRARELRAAARRVLREHGT